ncbi:hypothetical protein KJ966_22910 [bacterium]|nr:hypothetical protein [bacterium]
MQEKFIFLDTMNQSLVHSREVFAPAIELRAAGIILIHNHPYKEKSMETTIVTSKQV